MADELSQNVDTNMNEAVQYQQTADSGIKKHKNELNLLLRVHLF